MVKKTKYKISTDHTEIMILFLYLKTKKILFLIVPILVVSVSKIEFASTIENVNGYTVYRLDSGEFAQSIWAWIDDNNDSIAECYRFNENGQLSINYKDRYGKETNEKGQLIEDGIVVRKYLSSGLIIAKNSTPANEVNGNEIETIDPNKIVVKDKWTGKEKNVIVHETNSILETIDGEVIGNRAREEVDILNGETAENGIIYVGERPSKIEDNVMTENEIIPGKDLRKYIKSKTKCKEKEIEVYIYGGKRWNDVIVLSGDGASLKIDLKDNNYIYFEVAHQNHREDAESAEMRLDMYVDGKWYSDYDEFVDGEPEIVEEIIDNGKEIEIKVNIVNGAKGRKVYIRNGRLKKIKVKE